MMLIRSVTEGKEKNRFAPPAGNYMLLNLDVRQQAGHSVSIGFSGLSGSKKLVVRPERRIHFFDIGLDLWTSRSF